MPDHTVEIEVRYSVFSSFPPHTQTNVPIASQQQPYTVATPLHPSTSLFLDVSIVAAGYQKRKATNEQHSQGSKAHGFSLVSGGVQRPRGTL